MPKNIGPVDRALRVLVGLGLLSLFFVLEGSSQWLGALGLIPLATALLSYCPAYALFGLNTCPAKSK